jgi:hypothetical protein
MEMKEIITAGQFLILTGLILPLLPTEPVTTLTRITPRQAWLALVVVCTLSYASYLAQRYWAPAAGGLWMAAMGGLYSSTMTTVVLARQAKSDESLQRHAQAGITLATGIMYLRILAIVAVFNFTLARRLIIPLVGLSLAAVLICALQYWLPRPSPLEPKRRPINENPLTLVAATIFAALFVLTSFTTQTGLLGVNISGPEFAPWNGQKFPTSADFAYLASKGVTFVRMPIAWGSLQPTLAAALDTTYLGKIQTAIAAAHANGISVIVDLHNSGSYCNQHLCALYARARRSRAAGRIRPELWTAAPADFFLT